jgi:hypothetical protein
MYEQDTIGSKCNRTPNGVCDERVAMMSDLPLVARFVGSYRTLSQITLLADLSS